MSPQSALATIAEVAIAIAGFGGVIAARPPSEEARVAYRELGSDLPGVR